MSPSPPPREELRPGSNGDNGRIRHMLGLLWLLVAASLTVLFFLPLDMGLDRVALPFGLALDEVLHFSFFAALAWTPPLFIRSRLILFLVILCLLLLGLFSEIFQVGVPNRRFSEIDLLANTLGCLAGVLLGLILRRLLRGRSRK